LARDQVGRAAADFRRGPFAFGRLAQVKKALFFGLFRLYVEKAPIYCAILTVGYFILREMP
jgi:hypothetical protein